MIRTPNLARIPEKKKIINRFLQFENTPTDFYVEHSRSVRGKTKEKQQIIIKSGNMFYNNQQETTSARDEGQHNWDKNYQL